MGKNAKDLRGIRSDKISLVKLIGIIAQITIAKKLVVIRI